MNYDPRPQRSGSTLAQVMACCLTATSHYLNQCWLISEALWYSWWTISLEMLKISIIRICCKIVFSKLWQCLSGNNELKSLSWCLVFLIPVFVNLIRTNKYIYIVHILRWHDNFGSTLVCVTHHVNSFEPGHTYAWVSCVFIGSGYGLLPNWEQY